MSSVLQVVICGGGAQGAAIAYRLAEEGWGDQVLMIEQGELGGGTTWHATGDHLPPHLVPPWPTCLTHATHLARPDGCPEDQPTGNQDSQDVQVSGRI